LPKLAGAERNSLVYLHLGKKDANQDGSADFKEPLCPFIVSFATDFFLPNLICAPFSVTLSADSFTAAMFVFFAKSPRPIFCFAFGAKISLLPQRLSPKELLTLLKVIKEYLKQLKHSLSK